MMICRHLTGILLFSYLVASSISASATPSGSTGSFVTLPAMVWTSSSGGSSTTASGILLLPSDLDGQGTLSLVMKTPESARLVSLEKNDVPDSIKFLFSEADRIYVHVDFRNSYNRRSVDMIVDIPYDKTDESPRTRTVKFLDAAGKPLRGLDMRVSLPSQNGYYSPSFSLPIRADGTASIPIEYNPEPMSPYRNQHSRYAVTLENPETHQQYKVDLSEKGTSDLTTVIVPYLPQKPAVGIATAKGRIIDGNGNPQADVSIDLELAYPAGSDMNWDRKEDPATVTLTKIVPPSDATFEVAVPFQGAGYAISGGIIKIRLVENKPSLFTTTFPTLKAGETTDIRLVKRQTLTAMLKNANGEPVVWEALRSNKNSWPSVKISKIKSEAGFPESDGLRIWEQHNTTGSLTTLDDIPVPGKYVIEVADSSYGPVEIGETSPTEVLEFHAIAEDGRMRGKVFDENDNLLSDAVVVLWSQPSAWDNLKGLQKKLPELQSADKDRRMAILDNMTTGAVDCIVTTATGEYDFLRYKESNSRGPKLITVSAPNRVSAYYYEMTSTDQFPLWKDITVPDVHVPATATATATIYPPSRISDPDHLGKLKPFPSGKVTGKVFSWDTRSWFGRQSDKSVPWQYEISDDTFTFSEPFHCTVPAGTSYTLGARSDELKLSLQLWRCGPTPAGSTDNLASATLRSLQPFYLKVSDADGKPVEGIRITSIYAFRNKDGNGAYKLPPETDDQGMTLMYGDEGLAPEMTLMGKRSHHFGRLSQRFKIQTLDTSTSVPVLQVQFNPEK